jgi:hypothetical protein
MSVADGSGPDATPGGEGDAASSEHLRGELILPDTGHGSGDALVEAVEQPAKVMRIGSMVRALLEEVRSTELDEPSRVRLKEIFDTSVEELAGALSPDLQAELRRLAPPLHDGPPPSEAELRVAKAQLVGWLEGLFHGIQATLFAQQMAARQQLEQMRGRELGGPQQPPGRDLPGTYL